MADALEELLVRFRSFRRLLNAAPSATPVCVGKDVGSRTGGGGAAALGPLLEQACDAFGIRPIEPVTDETRHLGVEGLLAKRLCAGGALEAAARALAEDPRAAAAAIDRVDRRDPRRRFEIRSLDTQDGGPLQLYSRGPEEEPAFLAVLPYGVPADAMFRLAEHVSRRHRFLAFEGPDLLSHPDEFDTLAHGIESTTGDILTVLDHCGISRVHLVGVCGSAMSAVRFAIRHPERVASLTLGNGLYPTETMLASEQSKMLQNVGGNRSRARVMSRFMRAQDLSALEPDCPQYTMVPYVNPDLLYMFATATRSLLEEAVDAQEFDEWLAAVGCPSLVIVCERDTIVEPMDSHRIASRLKNCHKIVDEHGSHLSLLSAPAPGILDATLRFYAESGR